MSLLLKCLRKRNFPDILKRTTSQISRLLKCPKKHDFSNVLESTTSQISDHENVGECTRNTGVLLWNVKVQVRQRRFVDTNNRKKIKTNSGTLCRQ